MDTQTILANVLSPAALFFALGFFAVLVHSDLELPYPLPKFFSTYLLISIGYTGGEKLAHAGLTTEVTWTILAAMAMAVIIPFYTFFFLRRILSVYDAAAMAATYGSISIVTFVIGTEFLNREHVEFGGHMVAVMSLMESPAVIMGIMLVRMFAPRVGGDETGPGLKAILHESFFNGTVLLLIGSLIIGVITGRTAGEGLRPFMSGIFKGIVLLFLLDVGMLAAKKAGKLVEVGPKLVAFGILAPLANAALGIGLAYAMGMGKGDALLFTLLCASSSYIVVPAAMRQAVPEANPGLFELLSLSVTFPLNISVGIPLYYGVISRLWA
ncbi:MAG: sodium-dependent bicarbonate transport family permease [Planctomycetes bacterium]|nr:sodium-dependent bicarbonate transport family permease [Planctomycetota bacterium]